MKMNHDAVRTVIQWLQAHGYVELAGIVWLATDPIVLPGAAALPDNIDDSVEEVVRGLKDLGRQDVAAQLGIVVAVVTAIPDPEERRLLIGSLSALQRASVGPN